MGHCGITPGGSGGSGSGGSGSRGGQGQFLMTFQGKYPLFTTLNPDVNPLPACMAKSRDDRYMSKFLPGNYSGSLWSPAMLTLADGSPIICEGYSGPDNEQGVCMKFNMAKDTWSEYSTTPKKRWGMASDYHPKVGLIMAGGATKPGETNTNYVHISRDNAKTFQRLADLPIRDKYGQLFILDEKKVFYRHGGSAKFWILDLENNTWTAGPELRYDHRRGVSAGVVTRSSGEKEVVFMAGTSNDAPDSQSSQCTTQCQHNPKEYTKKVEIYNVATNTVRDGIDTPKFWEIGWTVPYMNSFIIQTFVDMDDCCGYWSNNNKRSIYRYNDDGTFTLMEGQAVRQSLNNNGGYWVDNLCGEEEQ